MDIKCYACIGGRKAARDVEELAKGVHVVVGTSGRVVHMIKRGALKPEKIKLLCIDEADEMLSSRSKYQTMRGRSIPTLLPVLDLIELKTSHFDICHFI